jgi:hypothetical protein
MITEKIQFYNKNLDRDEIKIRDNLFNFLKTELEKDVERDSNELYDGKLIYELRENDILNGFNEHNRNIDINAMFDRTVQFNGGKSRNPISSSIFKALNGFIPGDNHREPTLYGEYLVTGCSIRQSRFINTAWKIELFIKKYKHIAKKLNAPEFNANVDKNTDELNKNEHDLNKNEQKFNAPEFSTNVNVREHDDDENTDKLNKNEQKCEHNNDENTYELNKNEHEFNAPEFNANTNMCEHDEENTYKLNKNEYEFNAPKFDANANVREHDDKNEHEFNENTHEHNNITDDVVTNEFDDDWVSSVAEENVEKIEKKFSWKDVVIKKTSDEEKKDTKDVNDSNLLKDSTIKKTDEKQNFMKILKPK